MGKSKRKGLRKRRGRRVERTKGEEEKREVVGRMGREKERMG